MLVPISTPLQRALEALSNDAGRARSHNSCVADDALSPGLGIRVHTLFQISTSGALVQGIYERAVSSTFLLNHGDFGIGTFDNLDGEMVVLDGGIYQARSDGTVNKIVDDTGTPFAIVVKFAADQDQTIASASSFEELRAICDRYRDSDNLFYAFLRIDGHFDHIHDSRACKSHPRKVCLWPKPRRSSQSSISGDIRGTLRRDMGSGNSRAAPSM